MTTASNANQTVSQPLLRQHVEEVLAGLRPLIQWDGGDMELVDVTSDGLVTVRFHGACIGCPSLQATLRLGIEKQLRAQVPQVTAVTSIEGS